jgi:hypothetical protein
VSFYHDSETPATAMRRLKYESIGRFSE